MKTFLIIVTTVLILALAAVVYIWFVLQKTHMQIDEQSSEVVENKSIQEAQPSYESENATNESIDAETPIEPITEPVIEPIVVETAELSDTQKKLLDTFGFEGDTVTITPNMISCAEDAVGKERMDAIVGGASPSPLESLKLLPCFK